MECQIFEQVIEIVNDELITSENHLFSVAWDAIPPVGTNIYARNYLGVPDREDPKNLISQGVYEVIRVDFSVGNYTNKYELKTRVEIVVKKHED